ncbi:hemolysin family protein [Nanoarchaeota archaeon]
MTMLTDIIILVVLVIFSGLSSALESAIFSLNRYQVTVMYEKQVRGASNLKKLLDRPHRLLITLLLFNNVINIGASAFAALFFSKIFQSNIVGITTGIMTFSILIFGEITPKSIALKYNKSLALSFASTIKILQFITFPVIWILGLLVDFIHKVFRLEGKKVSLTEDELKHIVTLSEKEGAIKSTEKKLIHKVFKFDDMIISDIMIPRTKIVFGHSKMKIRDLLRIAQKTGHSRFPIYEKNRDNIVGLVYLKDALRSFGRKTLELPIKTIMKKPTFIPETKKLYSTLNLFQKGKGHLAVVVDEYGGVTGIVTLEDILEEIVGEIIDEADKERPKIMRLNKGTYRISGDADIEDVIRELRIKVKDTMEFDTFGGYILSRIGRIPKKGEKFRVDKMNLTIEEVFRNRIASVKVVKK